MCQFESRRHVKCGHLQLQGEPVRCHNADDAPCAVLRLVEGVADGFCPACEKINEMNGPLARQLSGAESTATRQTDRLRRQSSLWDIQSVGSGSGGTTSPVTTIGDAEEQLAKEVSVTRMSRNADGQFVPWDPTSRAVQNEAVSRAGSFAVELEPKGSTAVKGKTEDPAELDSTRPSSERSALPYVPYKPIFATPVQPPTRSSRMPPQQASVVQVAAPSFPTDEGLHGRYIAFNPDNLTSNAGPSLRDSASHCTFMTSERRTPVSWTPAKTPVPTAVQSSDDVLFASWATVKPRPSIIAWDFSPTGSELDFDDSTTRVDSLFLGSPAVAELPGDSHFLPGPELASRMHPGGDDPLADIDRQDSLCLPKASRGHMVSKSFLPPLRPAGAAKETEGTLAEVGRNDSVCPAKATSNSGRSAWSRKRKDQSKALAPTTDYDDEDYYASQDSDGESTVALVDGHTGRDHTGSASPRDDRATVPSQQRPSHRYPPPPPSSLPERSSPPRSHEAFLAVPRAPAPVPLEMASAMAKLAQSLQMPARAILRARPDEQPRLPATERGWGEEDERPSSTRSDGAVERERRRAERRLQRASRAADRPPSRSRSDRCSSWEKGDDSTHPLSTGRRIRGANGEGANHAELVSATSRRWARSQARQPQQEQQQQQEQFSPHTRGEESAVQSSGPTHESRSRERRDRPRSLATETAPSERPSSSSSAGRLRKDYSSPVASRNDSTSSLPTVSTTWHGVPGLEQQPRQQARAGPREGEEQPRRVSLSALFRADTLRRERQAIVVAFDRCA